jgi:hypothetical protein
MNNTKQFDKKWAKSAALRYIEFTYFFGELVSLVMTRVRDLLSAFKRSLSAFNFCNC